MNKNKIIGASLILADILLFILSPVIYRWYFRFFELQESYGGMVVVMTGIMLLIIGIAFIASTIFDKGINNEP